MSKWDPVEKELAKWDNSLPPARLWLRDDDAVEPTSQLKRLVDLTAQFDVPLTIAVIPDFATQALATYIAKHPNISVALHGYSHTNHAPPDQKKRELGLHRDKQIVLDELVSGRLKLEQMFNKHFINMLVPPWNRIDAQLVPELSSLRLSSLSTFGWENFSVGAGLVQYNTQVDIIDWKGSRGGRSLNELIAELANNVKVARQKGGVPVGILSHHLVHDAAAWCFLQELFNFCRQRKDIKWCHAASLPGVST